MRVLLQASLAGHQIKGERDEGLFCLLIILIIMIIKEEAVG